jgi:hypothetical protein
MCTTIPNPSSGPYASWHIQKVYLLHINILLARAWRRNEVKIRQTTVPIQASNSRVGAHIISRSSDRPRHHWAPCTQSDVRRHPQHSSLEPRPIPDFPSPLPLSLCCSSVLLEAPTPTPPLRILVKYRWHIVGIRSLSPVIQPQIVNSSCTKHLELGLSLPITSSIHSDICKKQASRR